MTVTAYQRLIDEDVEWLLRQPRTLERDHVEAVLKWCRANRHLIDEVDEMKRSHPGTMFTCPGCGGPHFNVDNLGRLYCANVSERTNFKVKVGGCGWFDLAAKGNSDAR